MRTYLLLAFILCAHAKAVEPQPIKPTRSISAAKSDEKVIVHDIHFSSLDHLVLLRATIGGRAAIADSLYADLLYQKAAKDLKEESSQTNFRTELWRKRNGEEEKVGEWQWGYKWSASGGKVSITIMKPVW